MGLKNTGGGEIIPVQGGHIIRATGRKDRHSKVFTAKGARDRRVRLAAHTAIQFYDVQDRLGYDRPSKAVDWLINKAKAEIDKLAKLPPWDPTANIDNLVGSSKQIMSLGGGGGGEGNLLDPRCVESSSGDINSFSLGFQNYPRSELVSPEGSSQNQDLCGSDHDPGIFHGFEGGWANPHDMGRFSRLMGWGSGNSGSGGDSRSGILFNYPPTLSNMANYCHNNNERSTLQSSSSYCPLGRVFEDNNQLISGIGHGSNDSLMGYYIPTQIQGANSMSNNRAFSSSLPPNSSQH